MPTPLDHFEVRHTKGALVLFTEQIKSYEDVSNYLIEYLDNNVDEWGGFYWGQISSHHVTIFSRVGAHRVDVEGNFGNVNSMDLHDILTEFYNQVENV